MHNKELMVLAKGILKQTKRREKGSITRIHLVHDLDVIQKKIERIVELLEKE